jgi:hypothetical protein
MRQIPHGDGTTPGFNAQLAVRLSARAGLKGGRFGAEPARDLEGEVEPQADHQRILDAAVAPRALDPEANPAASAPEGIKPEWYFLSQYQALKLFPGSLELLGQALLGLVPLAMIAVPFLDRSIPADARGRLVTRMGIAALLGLVAMTLWGWLS